MLLDYNDLHKKLNIRGIIHIGANKGEEYEKYKYYGVKNMVFIEPRVSAFEFLKNKINDENVLLFNLALGNKNGTEKLNVSTGRGEGASSSILNPKLHLSLHPNVKFGEEFVYVKMEKLDNLPLQFDKYNMLTIDVQGYELEVLLGSQNTLNNIDYIHSEVNNSEVYENCAKVDQLDKFLSKYNFVRVLTDWKTNMWGDAFYIKLT